MYTAVVASPMTSFWRSHTWTRCTERHFACMSYCLPIVYPTDFFNMAATRLHPFGSASTLLVSLSSNSFC